MKEARKAKSIQCLIIKARFEAYRLLNNVLVDVYAKQESLNCASEVFNRMPNKDVVSWTSLVTGYVHNDCYEEALKLFCDMKIRGIHPDQVIVASILSACAELSFGIWAASSCKLHEVWPPIIPIS
ncbi:hypothetical protein SLE2022_027560 [Rubroshorea leprosula]